MWRWASRVCAAAVLLSAGLAGWGAWRAHHPPPEAGPGAAGGGLEFDRPARDLGEVRVGEHVVEFVVTNRSARECRILGTDGRCTPKNCFVAAADEPVSIPAGQSYAFRCVVRVYESTAGPFENAMTVFVDDGGTRAVRLTVRGVGTVPPGGNHAHESRPAAP